MSNLEIEFGNNQGSMDALASSKEAKDAGTIHSLVVEEVEPEKHDIRPVDDQLARSPKTTSEASLDDDKEE